MKQINGVAADTVCPTLHDTLHTYTNNPLRPLTCTYISVYLYFCFVASVAVTCKSDLIIKET